MDKLKAIEKILDKNADHVATRVTIRSILKADENLADTIVSTFMLEHPEPTATPMQPDNVLEAFNRACAEMGWTTSEGLRHLTRQFGLPDLADAPPAEQGQPPESNNSHSTGGANYIHPSTWGDGSE